MKPIEKYRLEYTIGHADGRHMGMAYTLEECIALAKFEGRAEWDDEVEVRNTASGISLLIESEDATPFEIARLREIGMSKLEEEVGIVLGALQHEIDQVETPVTFTTDMRDEWSVTVDEVTGYTESAFRIVRRALEIVEGIYDHELNAEDAQAHAFVAAALLKNVVTKE